MQLLKILKMELIKLHSIIELQEYLECILQMKVFISEIVLLHIKFYQDQQIQEIVKF